MKLRYAPHARVDLDYIANHSRSTFGPDAAAALRTYIRAAVARIAGMPESGEAVPERPGVRVVALVRYPFRIFYTVGKDGVTILHVRHTSRRPWGAGGE
jgi:toxin ParE1/3/4